MPFAGIGRENFVHFSWMLFFIYLDKVFVSLYTYVKHILKLDFNFILFLKNVELLKWCSTHTVSVSTFFNNNIRSKIAVWLLQHSEPIRCSFSVFHCDRKGLRRISSHFIVPYEVDFAKIINNDEHPGKEQT